MDTDSCTSCAHPIQDVQNVRVIHPFIRQRSPLLRRHNLLDRMLPAFFLFPHCVLTGPYIPPVALPATYQSALLILRRLPLCFITHILVITKLVLKIRTVTVTWVDEARSTPMKRNIRI
ncbi:hypothetical protein ARMSODRAFT_342035 [Armillaria solidipes]|uniref:Uncharacterized protein n=1 Tax=Armillaria solidipes TaxID=1076256 RepID=A0A2H3BQ85_9AGAR|nr:hypothetical protein ARMSODRAFT_342035 [Armillaria solidipes]